MYHAGENSRQAVLDLDKRLCNLTHQLGLSHPTTNTQQVPRDLKILSRRLKRRTLVGPDGSEVIELGELISLFSGSEDVDTIVELVGEVEDVIEESFFGKGGDKSFADFVVRLTLVGRWDEVVGGCVQEMQSQDQIRSSTSWRDE